uniref:Uncharacterized protein n=1 Tax=Rhizophora mucronata TaxID=61149 RepID=A0A2P2QYI9_RHIMU
MNLHIQYYIRPIFSTVGRLIPL